MDEINKKCKKLDELRQAFESYDIEFTKWLKLQSMSNQELNSLLDIVPASGTRLRIVREMQKRGMLS